MAPRKLSDSDKSEIIELYKQSGQTTTTLAAQFGVSNSTISRILKSMIPPEEYSELISQKRMAGSDKAESASKQAASKPSAAEPAEKKAKKTPAKKTRVSKKEAASTKEAAPARAKKRASKSDTAPNDLSEIEPSAGDDPAVLDLSSDDAQIALPKLKTDAAPQSGSKESGSKELGSNESGTRRRRRRSKAAQAEDEQLPLLDADSDEETAQEQEASDKSSDQSPDKPQSRKPRLAAPVLASAEADEDDEDDEDDLLGLDETLGDDFGDDDDDLDEEDDDDEGEADVPKPKLQSQSTMSIMPLEEAVMPKPCYLVVDMRSELITRPLSEFADLGQVPSSEEKSKTLPVFDNHRVARRFSRNKQRVIKVPDGNLIMRTSPYLQAKGITRLLVDGQVFDLN